MPTKSRSLPQARPELDSAMALVCAIPASDRAGRRVTVQSVVSHAVSSRELETGVAFRFEGDEDIARDLLDLVLAERTCCAQFSYAIDFEARLGAIELRVEGVGQLVQPLKDMYSAFTTGVGAHG
jgi:hypothetical protein